MMHPTIFLVAALVQIFYHYGAYASPTWIERKVEPGIGGNIARNGISVFSSSSSSSGPGGWSTVFSGPQTGGSTIAFSTLPFGSKGKVHISKSESTSSGTDKIQSHVMTMTSDDDDDDDDISVQLGSFGPEEEEEIMPFYGWKQSSANAGVHKRLLGGSGSRSGLLGLGLGIL